MGEWIGTAARVVAVGVGATLCMDLWSWLLRRAGVATLDYALLGRWCGHWRRGQWFHAGIQNAAAVRGETALGWALHYAAGVALAAAFFGLSGQPWLHRPTPWPALCFGLVSVSLPWLVLQPALGAGWAGSRVPRPWRGRAAGLATHAVFGLGLYLSALALTLL